MIMAALADEVADGNILRLVEKFLRSGVMEQGVFKPTTVGTPQGGVFSPLLANIALNHLDWQLDAAGYRLVRYADDFVVLCKTEREAKEARGLVERLLTELGLTLSAEKTQVTRFARGFCFLGFDIRRRTVRMRTKSVQKFKAKVREWTRAETESGQRSHRETEPCHSRHGPVLCDGVRQLSCVISFTGRVDSHAATLHAVQAEVDERQLPTALQASGAFGGAEPGGFLSSGVSRRDDSPKWRNLRGAARCGKAARR